MTRACRISIRNPLTLASASPRRRRLLQQIKLPFEVVPSLAEESRLHADPESLVQRLAAEKAGEVFSRLTNRWTLGADTIVVIDREILGKPADADDAVNMLRRLSGKEHRVITGFCVLSPEGEAIHSEAVTTLVRFKALSEDEIRGYTATGEPLGKAGAYAIQGVGAFLVMGVTGSYTNVVGLPVCALVNALLRIGALETFPLPE
ncbi:Maf family protein [Desulfatiglans anilini]|uniref:Maf family protein n=1 Tax=Desulfatiglans anilini TaxID=90728 RepID=UPI0003FF384E|nr:nucleoside triphosphate pyrophosphatase [Desulfatiglans anilini]